MRNTLRRLWQDESAQGTSEYILLLVAIIAVAALFRNQIKEIISKKMGEVGSEIGSFNGGN